MSGGERVLIRWRFWLATGALVAIVGIGWLDYLTGQELAFALFYLGPIVVAAWWTRAVGGAVAALAAASTWILVELFSATGDALWVSMWNGFTRLGVFLAIALLIARVRRDGERLAAANMQLTHLLGEAEALARTDPKTRLPNSRAFREILDAELAAVGRENKGVTLAFIDADNFKRVNDLFGHEAGDQLLGRIADTIDQTVRQGDVAARLGGDEFIVLLRNATPEGASDVAHRILERMRIVAQDYPATDLGVSIGVAHFSTAPHRADDAIRRADDAMYRAKREGRGRVIVWSDSPPGG